jgi:hypothetical protein
MGQLIFSMARGGRACSPFRFDLPHISDAAPEWSRATPFQGKARAQAQAQAQDDETLSRSSLVMVMTILLG